VEEEKKKKSDTFFPARIPGVAVSLGSVQKLVWLDQVT
jgi:hypothetical protein